ncbi:MAG: sulfatase-like hydrolase/transferase [Caldilineaceae bacterium]
MVPQHYVDMYDLMTFPCRQTTQIRSPTNLRSISACRPCGPSSATRKCDCLRQYWAYCTMEDELFGLLLDKLAVGAGGQHAGTLCDDHGEYCGSHGIYCKGVPSFQAYHVPAIVRYPSGIVEPGREENAFVSLADFAPTFMELAGAEIPADLTGEPVAVSAQRSRRKVAIPYSPNAMVSNSTIRSV